MRVVHIDNTEYFVLNNTRVLFGISFIHFTDINNKSISILYTDIAYLENNNNK